MPLEKHHISILVGAIVDGDFAVVDVRLYGGFRKKALNYGIAFERALSTRLPTRNLDLSRFRTCSVKPRGRKKFAGLEYLLKLIFFFSQNIGIQLMFGE